MKRGAGGAAMQMGRTGMEAGGAQMEYNPYAEDPRPNLYNIVKNTKENNVSIFNACKTLMKTARKILTVAIFFSLGI